MHATVNRPEVIGQARMRRAEREREEPQCQTENDLYRIKQLKTITGARQLHFSRLSPILSSAEEGEVNARRPQSISDERLSKSIYQLFFRC